MHSSLGIHIEQPPTTRRADRRVVLVIGAILAGLVFGYGITRMPYVIAQTVSVQPKHEVASVRILKTPGNSAALNSQFGTVLPLEGLPITLRELISASAHELTFHIDSKGNRAVALDTVLPESVTATFAPYGYQAWKGKNSTLIALINEEVTHTPAPWIFAAFIPWHDGEVTIGSENAMHASIHLQSESLTIRGVGTPGAPIESAKVPVDSQVVLSASITENTLPLLGITDSLEPITASAQFTHALTTNGAAVTLTRDAEGYGYFLQIPALDMQVEELATLGKEIANRQNLSTVLWTSLDGTPYRELRAASAISVEISAEQDFSFITIRNGEIPILRLTKTPDVLTISNRSLGLSEGNTPSSSCLPHAHTWGIGHALLSLSANTHHSSDLQTLLAKTKEIAVSTNKIRVCW